VYISVQTVPPISVQTMPLISVQTVPVGKYVNSE